MKFVSNEIEKMKRWCDKDRVVSLYVYFYLGKLNNLINKF